ncbi:MAG TPA: hypothetical protein DEG76_13025 [Pseudohongiella sp.]|uniref:hypothetical protein n=1 Tax=Pseudohongiella sp. O18 TaxID=2904248 RepID=UPI000C92E395|nr:hypothetical protein [Pseudohongiella sp. O18]MAO39828.1 hypothetical protein [Pseudohongiella sp.]HBX38148.1 hypothetical protein [Pseudohongiella sp.]|tara:strand:- start:33895 stop:34140 length:246 start_codon:yes stop_codon:yes gene_type:complete
MNVFKKIVTCPGRWLRDSLVAAMLFAGVTVSPMAVAHEGHGTPGTVLHDIQHAAWLVLAISAVVIIGMILKQKWNQSRRGD